MSFPVRHGTNSGYKQHAKEGIPYPEDTGGISCGCRMAHRLDSSAYRAKNNVQRLPCASCGQRRAIIDGREGRCAECWQKAELARRGREEKARENALESADELIYGRWVNDRGVMRWRDYETESDAS